MEPPEGGGVRKKPKGAAASPAVASTGDDTLGEIFLRLPDTATLARAALACKRWRRVASDPALLLRFHSLHRSPPLLGFIMSGPPPRAFSYKGPDRLFLAAPSSNPHLNAAAAAADFYFEDFAAKNPRSGSVIDEWLLRGYDSGRLLLTYGFIEHEELAVYDPIARTTDLVCRPDIMQFDFEFVNVHYALLVDEADASSQVVGAQFWNGRIRAAIFSSRTDMAEHGGLSLVASKEQLLQLWVRDNNGGWVIQKQVSLLKQFGLLKKLRQDEWMKRVRILAVRDGHVYMEFWSIRKPNSYLLVLNWETMKLSVFANDTNDKYRGPAFPFFMTWAPPLLSPAKLQGLRLQGDLFRRNGNTCYVSK
ncbi:hypothetical protein BAE44_0019767 [Dichanthelium oligosanthes]|uniref:F-box domain-containing protein n=1 Tax=Dichanthelium oligosanthes TaxID=888268 RepID=A0A1E5V2E2_9POAL|nr:hypothetical protein BAE44_0019767 [Dichanthelium oligosanthes]